jgi:glutamate dehydrogenase
MSVVIPAVRRKLIERIVAATRSRKSVRTAISVEAFLRQYFRGVAEEDLSAHPSAEFAAAALAHLRSATMRRRHRPQVRVFNAEAARDGWTSKHTVVEVTTDDMPFLVDSLGIVLGQEALTIHVMVHPVLAARRDRSGKLIALADVDAEPPKGFTKESWQHVQIDRIEDPARLKELERKILRAFDDVRLAVSDWQRMRQQALDIAASLESAQPHVRAHETEEARELLEWISDNHFTFLGYREYRLERGRSEDTLNAISGTGLGILRSSTRRPQPTVLRGELRDHARRPELLTITKANSKSTVHRSTYLDYIGIKTFDKSGRVTGERRFLGLFTSSVYHRSPREIPLLRHKIARVIAHFGLDPASHDAKAVVHVLETYPRDELFQARSDDLIRIVRGIVNLYERRRVRVFLRRDVFNRFYSALIYVPRDRYNTQVREKLEAVICKQLRAESSESQVQISESALARLHIIARVSPENAPRVDVDALEQQIADAVHTWDDHLRAELIAAHGEFEGRTLAERYRSAFPAAYEEEISPQEAIHDIAELERVVADPSRTTMRLIATGGDTACLRLFRASDAIALSRALPILENLGFLVISERPYLATVAGHGDFSITSYEMRRADGKRIEAALDERLSEAFLAVLDGRAENDGFNRLVVQTAMRWRQAMVLRAYCRYLLQTSSTFSQPYMEQVLAANAPIAGLLWQLFEAQFDPRIEAPERGRRAKRLRAQLKKLLDGVKSLDEDRIVRRFMALIGATLRTNYFQTNADGSEKPYVSFKLDPRSIPDLPLPRPAFEIFVYSPRMEGVHLRMGLVARGGLRWSDRREDFRTEVLGLMKAQNVKNTLIVPVGAKGGFVPKRLPTNGTRDDIQREGVECYRLFIRGLLDVTDNIVNDRVVPPANVVRRDGDDAYLVVAADKGTATFSDIANAIAADYGFWLGDAFASGGSAGYDHKKMGITARGAWECVKRHFRELGIDTQSQEFTAIGIGDMSGDVFGNGMLCSPHMKLLAAFNHQHIFLDPSPDAAKSFAERKRLFALPRSTWEDYDRKLISKGGGVYSRSAKTITISPQARAMLGIDRDTLTPIELIRAVLCMPVDLLWNGGIGTYVKASDETNADVGDRANDAVRVNGRELRCRVVGEGGNLGFSQRGRIEYAATGGRINTDFVDNSGGVDCSDHEVNIKILLNNLPKRAGLTLAKRNKMLADMTESVATLVLRDNYLQSQALSLLEFRAAQDLQEHAHMIRSLELSGHLDRALEFLPATEEIAERHRAGQGLTRPELAILLAYAKMTLYTRLIDSDVPEDPYLSQELDRYFPELIERRFGQYVKQHRLRREIIATATTNSVINRMGATFARRLQEDTGASAAAVVRAYAIAREAFEMRKTWSEIEALDNKIAAATQYELMRETTRLLRFSTYWLVHHQPNELNIDAQVQRFQRGLTDLDQAIPRVLAGADLAAYERRYEQYRAAQVPETLANRMATLLALRSGFDLVAIAEKTRLPIDRAAIVYFGIGTSLSLDWLREQIEQLAVDGHWQAVARTTLRDNIYELQRVLCLQALKGVRRGSVNDVLDQWLKTHQSSVDAVRQTMNEMRTLPEMDFATLSVAVQAVRRVTSGD